MQENEQKRMSINDATDSSKEGPARLAFYTKIGWGKALANHTPVLTPTGFVPIGDLKIGSRVIGADGKPTEVIGVYPQGTRKAFQLTTTDGGSIVCCAEHLWTVTTVQNPTPQTLTTAAIAETVHVNVYGEKNSSAGFTHRYRLPHLSPVELESRGDTPIDPYLLGCLLGDGDLCNASLTIHKPERDVLDRCARRLPIGDAAVLFDDGNGTESAMRINGGHTMQEIRRAGLAGRTSLTKFVPQEYLFASVDHRLELLRGLLDTDGYVKSASIEYATSSDQLRDDVVFLARSLGGIVSCMTRTPHYTYKGERLAGSPSYRIIIWLPQHVPVASAKHLARWRPRMSPRYRGIDSVEPIGEAKFTCIKVAAEDGLFVAEDFIVTHNTTLGCHMPNPLIVGPEKGVPRDLGFTVKELHPRTWMDHFDLVHSLTYDRHDHMTVVYDTVDWLEPIIHAFCCDRDTERDTEMNPKKRKLEGIEDYPYGKGWIAAEGEFRKLIQVLDVLQHRRGMHVVFLMHAQVRTFKNPSGPDFDRWEPKPHARISAVIKEWAENFIFGKFQVDASKISEDKDRNKQQPDKARAKANLGVSARIVGTQECAEYEAKNRVRLPAELELRDPNELIDQLLGVHLGANVQTQFAARTERAMPSHKPFTGIQPPPPPRQEPSRVDVAPPSNGAAPPDRGDPNGRGYSNDAPTSDDYGGRVGDNSNADYRPAHHASRQADEKARQEDAFARARAGVEERDRQRAESTDPRKADARNWTEPAPTQQKLGAQQPDSQDTIDIRRMTEAVSAAQRISPELHAKVQRWAAKLNDGNPDRVERGKRLDFICDEVKKAINQAQARA